MEFPQQSASDAETYRQMQTEIRALNQRIAALCARAEAGGHPPYQAPPCLPVLTYSLPCSPALIGVAVGVLGVLGVLALWLI